MFGKAAVPIFRVVEVLTAPAQALVMAANKSSIARLPQPLRLVVDIAAAHLHFVAAGVHCVSDILKSSVHESLFLRESRCNGNCQVKKTPDRLRF